MPSSFNLSDIGRIPSPGDNLAIAIRRLEKGTQVVSNGAVFELSNTVLEGHRFAVQPIPRGGPVALLGIALWSWRFETSCRVHTPAMLPFWQRFATGRLISNCRPNRTLKITLSPTTWTSPAFVLEFRCRCTQRLERFWVTNGVAAAVSGRATASSCSERRREPPAM